MFDELKKVRDIQFGTGATDEQIAQYEKALGLGFPEDYKSFLREYGYAQWFGHYITGVSNDEMFDVLEATKYEREHEHGVPFPKLAISLDTDYVLFCDPAANAGQVCAHPIPAGESARKFNSLASFIRYKTGR